MFKESFRNHLNFTVPDKTTVSRLVEGFCKGVISMILLGNVTLESLCKGKGQGKVPVLH